MKLQFHLLPADQLDQLVPVALHHHHPHHQKLHLYRQDLAVLADLYLLLDLVFPHHLLDLVDQLVPEFLVYLEYLEYLANLQVLADQPFLLVLQGQLNLADLAHQVHRLLQGFQKLF